MKIVKEDINEKFAEKSDPIKDMGIGITRTIKDFQTFVSQKRGINIEFLNDPTGLLRWASYYNRFDLAEYAIKNGANIDWEEGQALHFAAVAGNTQMGLFLLDNGADLKIAEKGLKECNSETKQGFAIIKQAFLEKRKRNVNEKFEEKSDPVNDLGIGIKAMWDSIKNGSILQIVRTINSDHLKDSYVVVDSLHKSEQQMTFSYYNYRNKQDLLNDPDRKTKNFSRSGWTITYEFFKKGNVVLVYPEDLNEKFVEKSDPVEDLGIGIANQFNKWLDEIKKSPNFKWNLNTIDSQLTLCAYNDKPQFIEYLIKKGANVHYHSESPLRSAAFMKNYDAGKILVENGADVKAALSFCKQNHHLDTIYGIKEILKQMKVNVNEKFTEEGDPLNDMGIGLVKVIKNWLAKNLRYPEESIINSITVDKDGFISTDRYLLFRNIHNFPKYIKFDTVRELKIEDSYFTTLKGLPKEVKGDLTFINNGIRPTEEEIKKLCKVQGEIILIPEWKHKQKKSRAKYKRLGPVLSRPSPRIDDKTPKLEQKWSRGYIIWKILDFIQKSGKAGRRYSEIVKFDSNLKGLTHNRRTLSTGVFNTTKKYTDRSMRKLYHRYILNNSGEIFLEKYRKAFDDGIDYSKGPSQDPQ